MLSMEPSSFTVVQCLLEGQSSIVVLVDTHSLDQPPQLVRPMEAGQPLQRVHVSHHFPSILQGKFVNALQHNDGSHTVESGYLAHLVI